MLVDSHCHLNMLELNQFSEGMDEIINNARENEVAYMLCVGVNLEDLPDVLLVSDQFVNVFASVGVHPAEREGYDPTVEELVIHADSPAIIAIGETGLDYFHCKGDTTWQRERFRRHIRAAHQVTKPLIIHTRDARDDTIRILKEENADQVGGVFHCFTESWDTAKKALDLGFYISFSGIVTFKNARELQEVAKKIPLDRMLIETDSPYLAPVPYRGKPNQPAYVRYVAEHIATLRNMPLSDIAEATTHNFFELFKDAIT